VTLAISCALLCHVIARVRTPAGTHVRQNCQARRSLERSRGGVQKTASTLDHRNEGGAAIKMMAAHITTGLRQQA